MSQTLVKLRFSKHAQRYGCILIILMFLGISTAYSQRNEIVAGKTNDAITLDGLLDEPAWKGSASMVELVQQSPNPGKPTQYKTTVRILVASDKLYFGFECADPEPAKIAVHTMQRDGNVEGDDTVAVVLDTYGDQRTGYFFRINSAGARVDGLVSGPEHPNLDWDGIWDARTARFDGGWSAEISIPSRTLAFSRGLSQWGANFERHVARDRTVLTWASPTLDSFFYDLSRAGNLEGMEGLRQGLGLDVSPYVSGRMKGLFQEKDRVWQGSLGFDVTYRVTSQMAAVFTANTDFAETEADSRQLNLTRFALFFPERRSFFLEGANQYEFGLGLNQAFIPFFSRRIGLYEDQPIPINGGVKLNGRVGRWNVGLLDVQTRDAVPGGSDAVVPGTNLFAGRVSYDMTSKFRLGTILTNGHPDGRSRNTLAGFDAVWRTSEFLGNKNLLVGGWTAFSAGDLPDGNRAGWGFKIDYPNDLLDCFTSFNQFGEALDPALGFLPRPGSGRLDLGCSYRPRPSKNGPFGWIRQLFIQNYFYRVTNHQGDLESWRFFWVPLNVELESGDRFEFSWVPEYEYLPQPFEIAENVILPVGSYRHDRFGFEFQTSSHRVLEFGTGIRFGTFYNGHLLQQEHYLQLTSPKGAFQGSVGMEQNFATLEQGKFVQRLWQLNMAYSFNPNLVLTSFLQYDTESQNVGNNLRLRWTIKPGNDLFIVWNRGWRRLSLDRDDLGLVPETELLAVKLRWIFRQ